MELGLEFEDIIYYESLESHAITHEETMETAIPEYCPDMSRIVDTTGQLFVQEKLPAEDRYTVAGTVKVTVLYTSEEVPGLKSMTVSVPFSCRLEQQLPERSKLLCVTGRVLMLEAKAVGSRRLYVRVMPEITAYGFRRQQLSLCSAAAGEPTVRVRTDQITLPLLTGVTEQGFSFAGETMLSAGQMPEELLLYRLCPHVSSVQRLGGKLMVKGELALQALFRSGEALLAGYDDRLPFSEIVDAAELPEGGEYVVTPTLSEGDVRLLRADGEGGFGVTAQVRLCVRVFENRTFTYVADLYSIRHETRIEQMPLTIHTGSPEEELVQEAVMNLELGRDVPLLFVTEMDCAPVTSTVENGRPLLRTAVHTQLLYLDESGAPVTTGRTEEVTVPVDEVKGAATARCCSASVQCGAACQVRLPVMFSVSHEELVTVNTITAVTMQTDTQKERGPSLVLRRMQPDETLWDVAKQYRTDVDAIRQANPAQSGADGMLLIPRVR